MRLLHYSPRAATPHSGACLLASSLYFKPRGSPRPPCSLGGCLHSLFPHPGCQPGQSQGAQIFPTRPSPFVPSKHTIPNNEVTLRTYKRVPGKPRKTPPTLLQNPSAGCPGPRATHFIRLHTSQAPDLSTRGMAGRRAWELQVGSRLIFFK